jgi:hypothetical protein
MESGSLCMDLRARTQTLLYMELWIEKVCWAEQEGPRPY